MAKTVKPTMKPEYANIEDAKSFGEYVQYKRTAQGMSIDDAASLCGINYRTLDKLEKGAEGTRLSTALYVAKMFGIKVSIDA